MKRWGWALFALLAGGCQCGGIDVEDAGFVCATDSDCIDGFACIKLRCKPVGTDGGATDGGKDGGSKDAGTDGGSKDAGVCSDGGTPKTEICTNGVDDDCDGKTDCADSDCLHESCTTDGGHVCCGNGSCVDLTASDSNCGGCGLACTNNHTCQKAGLTGRCSCQGSAVGCPGGQQCSGGLCDCDFNSDCANGEMCNGVSCEY